MQNWSGNFTEQVWRHLEQKGVVTSPAFRTETQTLTFADVFFQTNRAGNLLKDKGLRPGDRLLLVMRDSPSLVYAFLGAIRIGVVPVILNTLLPDNEYPTYAADSHACHILADQVLASKLDTLRGEVPILTTEEFIDQVSACSSSLDFYRCDPDTPAFWQYSSGSTGRPKAVIHSHKGPIEIFNRYAKQILQLTPEDRLFSTSRMFFGYGLGNSLLFPLMAGAEAYLAEDVSGAEKIGRILSRFKPTLFFAVPALYSRLLDAHAAGELDFSSIRLAISAGEALPSALYDRWRQATDIELLDGIGSTEALHIFASARAGDVRPGSCGRPLDGIDVKLVDNSGQEVPQGDTGNLMVRYPGLALGYWQRPELTKATFVDGWLNTRDVFRVDDDGYFWHMGRSDDMFKAKGMWVSPVEVEDVLLKHPQVLDCAVTGQRNSEGLTEVAAHIVLAPAANENGFADDIEAYLEGKLAKYKIPRCFHVVDTIPRTTTGKKKRYELVTGPPSA